MSSDVLAIAGILITVVCSAIGFFIVTKKNTVNVNPKTKSGNIDMSNAIIGNKVNINKDNKNK